MSTAATQSHVSRLADLIRGMESVMFTTVNPDGSVNSRPMVVQNFDFDGELWFFTHRSSGKVDSINEDSHVCMAFMDPSTNRYISASGTAVVLDDPWTIKKIWNKSFEKWYPDGPRDEDLALIRVRVTHAEYWDAPHSDVVESFCFTGPSFKFDGHALQKNRNQKNRLAEERYSHSW